MLLLCITIQVFRALLRFPKIEFFNISTVERWEKIKTRSFLKILLHASIGAPHPALVTKQNYRKYSQSKILEN